MNKKILAAVFSMALLCSCGNGNAGELSETGAKSVSLASEVASETTVTTTAAETTSEAVSEETEVAAEVSEAEEKVPITRDFFNDDVVFEEVMLPVKIVHYKDETVDNIIKYEYDAAGNESKYQAFIHEYDYNPDGTYNSTTTLFINEIIQINRFDENGYCIESTSYGTATNYEYEFDDAKRLIRKTEIHGDEKESFEYTYDKEGRLYEEINNTGYMNYSRFRHEYNNNIENIYCFRNDLEEEKLWKILKKDESGNIIKATVDEGAVRGAGRFSGKTFTEYKYDDMNRLIYEDHTISEDFNFVTLNDVCIYTKTYEYEGDYPKKETYSDYQGTATTEYFYNDDGSIISQYCDINGVITNKTEYAMIPKIKTDIEYKHYVDVNP